MGKITAKVSWTGEGMRFIGTADSNHAVVMDLPEVAGGFNSAPNPMELIAIALGGCANFYLVTVLKKMRKDVKRAYITVEAEMADKDPKIFTKINMTYHVEGALTEADVEKAIGIVEEKYCPVYQMLKLVAPVERKLEVVSA